MGLLYVHLYYTELPLFKSVHISSSHPNIYAWRPLVNIKVFQTDVSWCCRCVAWHQFLLRSVIYAFNFNFCFMKQFGELGVCFLACLRGKVAEIRNCKFFWLQIEQLRLVWDCVWCWEVRLISIISFQFLLKLDKNSSILCCYTACSASILWSVYRSET
jgi:hypothetical protein